MSLLAIFLMWGCQGSPRKEEPPTPYREDEQLRLKLFVEDIFELEKSKQYGRLYDKYTSPAFQKTVSRRNFLRLSQCVETHLGELVDYERKDWQFHKKTAKGTVFHSIRLPVVRSSANITEQLTMTTDGLDYRLTGLYWLTKHKAYADCIRQLQTPNTDKDSKTDEEPGQSKTEQPSSDH